MEEKSKQLKQIREKLGMSQPSFAHALGLDAGGQYISKLETGKRNVSDELLARAKEMVK
jgi:transcriptional regulator with XRE-family HTH domain